jgi:protein-L-isoaspartate(D-aspartate) O-methyltransferase
MDQLDLRTALVDRLIARRAARSSSVIRALRDVPRHVFLPDLPLDVAYADRSIALVLEEGITVSSASQPSMIAEMLEQLAIEPGNRILEIGTGSGYNAALLAQLCGTDGTVVTIDLDAALVERARSALASAGLERVHVLHGDGAAGAPDFAPFDRIILTVAADDIVDAWRLQLAPQGRLVLPLTLHTLQESVAFEGLDPMHSVSIVGASFVALRGSNAIVPREIELGKGPAVSLRVRNPAAIDRRALERAMQRPADFTPLEDIGAEDFWSGLDIWFDAHVPQAALAMAYGSGDGSSVEHWLSVAHDEPRFATTLALVDADAIAFLIRSGRGAIRLACYGTAGSLVEAARRAVAGWNEHGRPSSRSLSIDAYARTTPAAPGAVIVKPSITLALRWN